MSVLEDFEQVETFLGLERVEAEVVEDQQFDFGEGGESFVVGGVGAGGAQNFEQPSGAFITDGEAESAGGISERLGDPAFAGAGRSGDDEILGVENPVTGSERGDEGTVEAARGAGVEVFQRGVLAKLGLAQQTLETFGVAVDDFGVDRKGEPFFKGKAMQVRLVELAMAIPGSLSSRKRSIVG